MWLRLYIIPPEEEAAIREKWGSTQYQIGIDIATVREVALQAGGVGAVIVIVLWNRRLSREITQRKQAENELRVAKAQADAANRAKSEFLSSMSHELRTPLNAIIGFSEFVVEDETDPLTQEQQECIGQVMKAGHHLLQLIDDVLDLSKIEIGAVTLSIEPVNVSEVVDECVELTASFASRHGIVFENKTANADLPPIRIDRTRFKQVLLNFLSNAVKYNRENGSITIEQTRPSAETVRISVTDTGEGIPEDRLQNIFNPFDRLGAENTDIEGTGIGLTIAKRLVEQMGGEIGVESSIGKGSTFWITCPIAEVVVEKTEVGEPAEAAESPAEAGGTVLYIEDNPANLQLVRKIMGRHKRFALIDAPTAELGIELARRDNPDIIIMDINLPGMDGVAALAELRKAPETSDISVIALSAAAMPKDIERGKEAGFVDYLTKPINATALIRAIEGAMLASPK